MNSASSHYTIPQENGRWSAPLLAVAVHAALFAFLWIGIRWQSQTPVALEAEVWDLQARQAAPPPAAMPEPAPEPEPVVEDKPVVKELPKPAEVAPPAVDPEIALRKIKKQQAEQKAAEEAERKKQLAEKKAAEEEQRQKQLAEQKAEQLRKKQDEARKKQAEAEKQLADADKKKRDDQARRDREKAEDRKIAQLRKDNMARIGAGSGLPSGTGSPGSTGTAAKSTGARGDSSYAAQVVAKIKSNLTYGGDTAVPGNPQAIYKIQQLPSGEILSSVRIKSSGIPAYDAAVEAAIAKSSPLPRKKDGTVDREIDATFKLKEQP